MTEPSFASPHASALHQKIRNRTAVTGVIGLGYVGLGLAVELCHAGFSVVGIDVDQAKCDFFNRGASGTSDVPDAVLAAMKKANTFRAVSDIGAAGHLDTINICVPTPLRKTKDPDLSYVVAATHSVRAHLRPGMLVVLESTTYPGTTEEVVQSILEETGLEAGTDFFLAFSPERIDPGNPAWNTRNIPKVVGGLTPDCSELASALYMTAVDRVVTVSSPRAAEMVKLLENTFRAVNIGLVNELALMCHRIGINVWEVIEAAATKPFGFMPFYPGPGLGGHCIPIDPVYLSWKVREVGFEARFIDLAGQINAAMPHHVVDLIGDALNEYSKAIKGSEIVLIGVAYKPEVSDIRESPALDVMALLLKKGAHVKYHDPFVPHISTGLWPGGKDMDSTPYSRALVEDADCIVLLTDHRDLDYGEISRLARLIVDTRNAIKPPRSNVIKLGAPTPRAQFRDIR